MRNVIKNQIEFDWKPDKELKTPLSEQIVGYIIKKISSGDWLIGQKLPAQRELAALLNVNRSTIVEVYTELISLGVIESNFGKGTKIINNTWSLLFSDHATEWRNYIEGGVHKGNLQTIQVINKLEFDEGTIRLSTGEMAPELFPYDTMKKVLSQIPVKAYSLNYLEPLGLEELRIVICNRLKKQGIDMKPSQILIVSGSLQALQLIAMSILKPGATVYVEEPSYIKSLSVFESNGMNMKGVPMDSEGLIPWMINPKENRFNDSILYTIPSFHNPTGTNMSLSRREELVKFCKAHQLPIIEDDVYHELWFGEEEPTPLKALDTAGNILYLGSASKSLAPGLRVGWVAGPEPVVERLGDIKMQTDYGTSSLSQWALAEWMESGLYDEHLETFRKELRIRRDFVLGILNRHFNTLGTWNIPTGGYYIWLKLNSNISTDVLFKEMLTHNILINPGTMYSFKKNTYIRLSYSYATMEGLEKGLIRLAEVIYTMTK